ncbi:MAG: vanadium-dependent haloperoxidase, partial [Planctomycetes bacterium]|nr:vanadium-dependent haloperoxidase [Planctomycetota bacterium]
SAPEPTAKETGLTPELDRRHFISAATGLAAASAAGVALPALGGSSTVGAAPLAPPIDMDARAQRAFDIRHRLALRNFTAPRVQHTPNGDEALYPEKWGNHSKLLPHNQYGEVDPAAYATFVSALEAGTQIALEAVPSGTPNSQQRLRFHSPLAGKAFDLQGIDSHQSFAPAPPAFASAEAAGEIVENYWMALLRDVPFSQYDTHPLVAEACTDLNALSDFRGPRENGAVTARTLFRDAAYGCDVGPYLSQFWWKSQPFGAQFIEPRMRTIQPGIEYLHTDADWLARMNGTRPTATIAFDNTLRYMRTGRDLARWVHMDVLYQAYFQALLHMMMPPDPGNPFTGGGLGCPLGQGHPYALSLMQEGFATFGGPYYMTISTEVATRVLKATWFQKWHVHRRLRPEEFAGRVHHKLVSGRPYPLHPDVLNSLAVARIQSQHGGRAYLPQVFPEGAPNHPAYTAGHATVAGACVTILKALFHGPFPILNPRVPTDDGLALVPYTGPGANLMTVETELNKLAMNVAYGRHIAGVHWRSDGYESLRLGESLAIRILAEQRPTYAENFQGFTFRKFDGTFVTI